MNDNYAFGTHSIIKCIKLKKLFLQDVYSLDSLNHLTHLEELVIFFSKQFNRDPLTNYIIKNCLALISFNLICQTVKLQLLTNLSN